MDLQSSKAVDVVSIGMLLWSLLHPHGKHCLGENTVEIAESTGNNQRPRIDDGVLPALKELMQESWHHTPAERPQMLDVAIRLRDFTMSGGGGGARPVSTVVSRPQQSSLPMLTPFRKRWQATDGAVVGPFADLLDKLKIV